MIVDYNEIVKELISEDILKLKKGVFKNKGDKLTAMEKLLYSDERIPLVSDLVIGDIVVELCTTKIIEDDKVFYDTGLWLTDKDPITMNPVDTNLSSYVNLKRSFDIYQAVNNHAIYTNLIIKLNKKMLKRHPEINNITNI